MIACIVYALEPMPEAVGARLYGPPYGSIVTGTNVDSKCAGAVKHGAR